MVDRSCKLSFISQLLPQLFQDGHRILIFSQSCKMLSLVEKMILRPNQYRYLRLDGKVTKPAERQRRVNEFNNDERIGCFLLSTRVGGEGITLTGADRVLVIDPAWNPCVDAQAVDRAYRIGQTRDVLIYRLVTCNTVEEKIYKRQLLKGSLGNTLNGKRDGDNELAHSKRLFSRKDMADLFSLKEPSESPTCEQLTRATAHLALTLRRTDRWRHRRAGCGHQLDASVQHHLSLRLDRGVATRHHPGRQPSGHAAAVGAHARRHAVDELADIDLAGIILGGPATSGGWRAAMHPRPRLAGRLA